MRFAPSEEQLEFASAVDDVVEAAGGPSVARAWASGDTKPGLDLWRQLAETGVVGLRIDESDGGVEASASDMVVVFEQLGYHAVPGPYIESAVLLPRLVTQDVREQIASGEAIATAAVDAFVPHALDADSSTNSYIVTAGGITPASGTRELHSLDPTRRLFDLSAVGATTRLDPELVSAAIDEATLASSAMLVGAGERLLREAVDYAKIREQFGHPIGEFQAVKHALANVRVALTFARPLVHAASLDLDSPTRARSVSAAKVAAGDAANLAARAALQVHGAIGYTAEHDLSIWLLRVRALVGSWGTAAAHRARIAESFSLGKAS